MSPRLAQLFLAFHVFGVVLWISGLVTLSYLLTAAKNETDTGARARLAQYARKVGMVPDIGATLALLFGLHWLFAFKLYKMPYMHIKLTLVVVLIALHGLLRAKSKRLAQNAETTVPGFVLPLVVALTLGIIVLVVLKVPMPS